MEKTLSPTRGERMMRLFHKHAARAREIGISRQLIEDEVLVGDSIHLEGRRYGNFGLCSYLGLGDDKRLKEGAYRAIERFGTSYSSSIAYTAIPLYGELKERLEMMLDAHVVLAPTTTLAHFAALPVLIRPGDQVLVDAAAHASVQTATQLVQANGIDVRTVPHSDPAAVDSILSEHDGEGRVWLLIDGLYSMYGDLAPAAELSALLDRHPALHIYCDDAHGFGWVGEFGRGSYLARAPWHDRLIVVAGLSKSFGATGGIVVFPDPEMADMVELVGPPLTFGGPIPPASLGAGLASADIHLSDELPELQTEFRRRIDLVNRLAAEMGIPLADFDPTPIWYVETGDYEKMSSLFLAMRDAGFYLNGSAFPVVPHGHAGLRFTVTLYNSPEQIEAMLTALSEQTSELVGEPEIIIDLTAEIDAGRESRHGDGNPQ
jgi:7-keto-8-aminopelargonate synthetase-like enzyme